MRVAVHTKQPPKLFQFTNWNWRGVIIRVGTIQFDFFWRPQWSVGTENCGAAEMRNEWVMKMLKAQLDDETKRRSIKIALCATLPASQANLMIDLASKVLNDEFAPTCQPE